MNPPVLTSPCFQDISNLAGRFRGSNALASLSLLALLIAGCPADPATESDTAEPPQTSTQNPATGGDTDAEPTTSAGVDPTGTEATTAGEDLGGCKAGECQPGRNLERDILLTDLNLDLTTHKGTANITVAGSSTSNALTFNVGDLSIESVTLAGIPLLYAVEIAEKTEDTVLDIGVPFSKEPLTVTVEYKFKDQDGPHGYMPSQGVTSLWPYFCGNLFPCHTNPQDGTKFKANVIVDDRQEKIALYPKEIPVDVPAYVFAFAYDNFEYTPIRYTAAKTEVGLYAPPELKEAILAKVNGHLPEYFSFFEETYGDYLVSDKVASVTGQWDVNVFGGMEHHPFWHVAPAQDFDTHPHEAAHGWFGNGVRLECWEDFVLSEGVGSYITARAIEVVDGEGAGEAMFTKYKSELNGWINVKWDTIALPDETCNEIKIYEHPLWSWIPYKKGALFLREVALIVGREELDGVIAKFYQDHVGSAARMQDFIDYIQIETGFDANPLANKWLRSLGVPN